ncbi:multiple epidermal growth factor-like domains protein 11 isoform X2 [Ostrea edulis]|uniref:multiple epidermal growth factor-like domains protein 11 isoform X2 n=1 Tax=Ostrea edulis TaxID=37623 RepID=UPI0024AEDB75|nr:multiple epidermal growth factor-like domains protein 11 isoform X2 [Ostrea edulis]XP_048767857.2 multiple epidermal growth factor-like domains protein 11 isoform X2 [Ostrea edulis]
MVIIWMGGRLMVSLFITFSLQLVGGNGLSCDGYFKCCYGYKWDRDTEKCIPCEVGYYGIDCAEPCPFPSFGKECQLLCNCSEYQCNHKKGCPKSDCGPGYVDDLCDVKCRYPSFGLRCQGECLCEMKKCDPVNGCQGSLEGIIMEVVTTPAPKTRMTPNISTSQDMPTETSIQSDAASIWNNLNEKEKGMVISITTLGLLFLTLTVMYIWVYHRILVETNNRRKATEDSDENSAV